MEGQQARQPGPISEQCSLLEQEGQQLGKVLDDLEFALQQVLRPEVPTPPVPAEVSGTDPNMAPMQIRLAPVVENLRNMKALCARMIDRLAL